MFVTQDEELDDLAGQVQLLEQAKLRLEMNLEQLRKEHKKELTQRDEENEETRCNMTKKVKGKLPSVDRIDISKQKAASFNNDHFIVCRSQLENIQISIAKIR